jgi:zinc-ribbon domain
MALIACPECGSEVSDKAPTCPRCGVPIFRESKVVVYGYTQQFLINPKVQVFWNGSFVGSVKKGGRLSIDVDSDGEISFQSSIRKASLRVQAGRVTNIKISWDRITGKMIPQIVDVVTPPL